MLKNIQVITNFIGLIIFLLFVAGLAVAKNEIIEIEFTNSSDSISDSLRTLKSIVRVREISEQYATGGLYLMTHYGNYDSLFTLENQKAINNPMINQTWRFCSVFSSKVNDSVLVGRNWDNQNVGSIIISYYHPPNGYASISLSRAIDLGYPLNFKLDENNLSPFGHKLLLAPFYSMDGINEHGLSIAVTGISTSTHKPKEGKEPLFISFLIRKILDQCENLEKAIRLADKYVPFDLDKNSLSSHLYIVDATGKSAVLEYIDDQWRCTYSEQPWQIMTNKIIFSTPEVALKEKCWRYRTISDTMNTTNGHLDWSGCFNLLQNVSQSGTTWSVVYSLSSKELYCSVYQDWDKVYHLFLPVNEHH